MPTSSTPQQIFQTLTTAGPTYTALAHGLALAGHIVHATDFDRLTNHTAGVLSFARKNKKLLVTARQLDFLCLGWRKLCSDFAALYHYQFPVWNSHLQ